jgi:hypothetical protein
MKPVRAPLPGYGQVQEPFLAFHPEREQDRSHHPLQGLVEHGPYSQAILQRVTDPIRVALIAPAGELVRLEGLLKELEARHQPRERKQYLPVFLGMSRIFRVRAVAADTAARFELAATLEQELVASAQPHLVLAEALTRAINQLERVRFSFDVLLVYLPQRWMPGFWGGPDEDFDLHDYLKAVTAARNLPMQIVREDSALAYPCRCSVAWRLSIALYTKAGGIPWKLVATESDTAYIGLSYALRAGAEGTKFITCCSQVFNADGTGLEFIAYSPSEVEVEVAEGRNPFLSRHAMQRVMSRSLSLYQHRHSGAIPRRIVVHKTTEFKSDEVNGCFDVLRATEAIDLVQIQQDTGWRGVLFEPPRSAGKARPAPYPVLRGSYLSLGPREVLLWTQGDVPDAVEAAHYFKEGKGIPAPLLLRRFAGHGGWEQGCLDVLGLTKMNWNTDNLYDRLPVTIGFAQTLARVVKRLDRIGSQPFQFRLFM